MIDYGFRVRCIDDRPVHGLKNGKVDLTVGNVYIVTDIGIKVDLKKFIPVIHDRNDIGVYQANRFEVVNE